MSKYEVPEDHWEEDEEPDSDDSPVSIDAHEVSVIYTTDPDADMGYGREKYTAHLVHDERGPTVLYFGKHRWKGNFWRRTHQMDWRDVPALVRMKVAEVVDCEDIAELKTEHRLLEEGGESVWQERRDDDDE